MNENLSPAEADFKRLEALYQILPGMEKKSTRLLRSRTASQAIKFYNKYNSLAAELDLLKMEAESRSSHDLGLVASMMTGEEAAVKQAKETFENHLQENGFRSLEDAKAAVLSPEEEASLDAEIRIYKEEYAALLKKCGTALGGCQ